MPRNICLTFSRHAANNGVMTVNNTISRIIAFAAAQKWSRNRLATEAGLAESTIREIFEPGWNPRLETLLKLEAIVPDDFNQVDAA